jgi:hypothetical protein
MPYTKPEIINVLRAVAAVRGNDKLWFFIDNVQLPCPPLFATVNAYESDE